MTTITAKPYEFRRSCLIKTKYGYVGRYIENNVSLEDAKVYRTIGEFVLEALRYWTKEEIEEASPFTAIDIKTGEVIDEFEIKEG